MLGIIGGMGILAGKEFDAAVRSHGIKTIRSDKEHPCRVNYLLGIGQSPVPSITDTILDLSERGATKFVMACNTAHTIHSELIDNLPIALRDKVLHLINPVFDNIKNPIWLGTTVLGHCTNLVSSRSQLPSDKDQETIQHSIWMAKSLQFPYTDQIRKICDGYDTVVAGCTEMPAVLRNAGIKHVNPVDILIDEIKRAK